MALTRFSIEVGSDEGPVIIEGEGVVQITGAPAADPTIGIVEFLDALDPQAIEEQALSRLGWGGDGPGAQTAEVIKILRELVTGEQSTDG